MIAALRLHYQKNEPIFLNNLCISSQGSKATDERDKVFGLLGILTRRVSSPKLAKLLKIDYGLPVQTVYFHAAKSSILELQDLAICHCQTFTPKRIKNLPSWVPDWSTKSDRSPTIALRPHNRIEGRIRGKISFVSDAMRVNGYFVDTICYLTQKLSSENPLPDIQRIIIFLSRKKAVAQMFEDDETTLSIQYLEQVIAKLKRKTYHGRQSEYEALWRTLIADTADFKAASPQFQQHFDAVVDSLRLQARGVFWDRTRVHEETEMDLASRWRLLNDVEAEDLRQRIDAQDSRPYFRELVNTIEGRVFSATVKGFIGIGPPGAKPGDQIAILKGGWSPFILREDGRYFEMEGDAYVHGLKDAELLASVKARTQSLEIR